MNSVAVMVQLVKEERLLALARLLIEKLSEKSGQLTLVLKRFLKNYDKDGSGELEIGEFGAALRDMLPGVKEEEIEALAMRFDADASGSLTIQELKAAWPFQQRGLTHYLLRSRSCWWFRRW